MSDKILKVTGTGITKMTITNTKIIEIFDCKGRTAEITFENEKFIGCKYSVHCISSYNSQDWEFLGKVSKRIQKEIKKYSPEGKGK